MSQAGWRKSSMSSAQADSNCVEARVAPWRKSSRSSGAQDSGCVEARPAASGFQVRDSKLGDSSPIFDLEAADFTGLLRAAERALTSTSRWARALYARARFRFPAAIGARCRPAPDFTGSRFGAARSLPRSCSSAACSSWQAARS